MLKIPGISNLTFQNANKYGTQLFRGVDEAGMPVLITTKGGALYKKVTTIVKEEHIGNFLNRYKYLTTFNYWTNVKATVTQNIVTKGEQVLKYSHDCTNSIRFAWHPRPIGRAYGINIDLKDGIPIIEENIQKYNDIHSEYGHLSVNRVLRPAPNGTYTITTSAHANVFLMPNGTFKDGDYIYTKTFSGNRMISNKRGDYDGTIRSDKRDVFGYDKDGRLNVWQLEKNYIASE